MLLRRFIFSFLLIAGCVVPLKAQDLVQFSGVILASDSLSPIGFTHIILKGKYKGTVSDMDGFFSFVAEKGDTVLFSALGYEPSAYIIPADLEGRKYSVIQLLTEDTIHIAETVIYPWSNLAAFKKAFVDLDVPDDDIERARKNLSKEKLKRIEEGMANDADESADLYIRGTSAKYYYYGQQAPQQILNPIAWAQFIKAWKNGDFKRDKKSRD